MVSMREVLEKFFANETSKTSQFCLFKQFLSILLSYILNEKTENSPELALALNKDLKLL